MNPYGTLKATLEGTLKGSLFGYMDPSGIFENHDMKPEVYSPTLKASTRSEGPDPQTLNLTRTL